MIDVPWARGRMKDTPDDFFIQRPPAASIAAEVFHLAYPSRDAWTFLPELRPFHAPWQCRQRGARLLPTAQPPCNASMR
jgi:hypothetical protein